MKSQFKGYEQERCGFCGQRIAITGRRDSYAKRNDEGELCHQSCFPALQQGDMGWEDDR